MNLVWHIVKKDLRALRWPLVVWVALIAAKLGMGVILLTSNTTGDEELFNTLSGISKVLAGLEFLGVVLVAALIQEDMLVGTTAFWVTRPISGGRLLAAKLLGLGIIFVVIPVLVTLPWWIGCHLGVSAMAGAALETIALHLLVVLLGLLIATVTDGLGRFLLWVIALVAAVPLLAATIAFTLKRMNAVVPGDLAATRVTLGAGMALLGLTVVVTHQFVTRRVWRSVSMIAAFIALMALIELAWPFSWHIDSQWKSFLAHKAEKAWPLSAKPEKLIFTMKTAGVRRPPNMRPDQPIQLWVDGYVAGVLPDQMLVPAVANYRLNWVDGVTDEGWSWFQFFGMGNLLTGSQKQDLVPAELDQKGDFRVLQNIPAKLRAKLSREPAVYTLQSRFSLVEAGTPERVPSAPGNRIMVGVVGERIAGVEKEGEAMAVTFVRHRPALISDYLTRISDYVLGSGTNWSSPTQYLLMDKAGKVLDRGAGGPLQTARVAAVEISWETKTYRAMGFNYSSKPRWEAIKALEEAELARMTYRSLGSFAYDIKVDPFIAHTTD